MYRPSSRVGRVTGFDSNSEMRPGSRTLGISPEDAKIARKVPQMYRMTDTQEYEAITNRWTSTMRVVDSTPNKETAPSTKSILRTNRKSRIKRVERANKPQNSQRARASWKVSSIRARRTRLFEPG